MAGLDETQCYKAIKRIDISDVRPVVEACDFPQIRHRGNYEGDLICGIIRQSALPAAVVSFVDGLGLGGEVGRAVLRQLSAHQGIPRHTDAWMPGEMNWRRFQVPMVTHPDIVMRWPDDDEEVHLEAGWLWEVRYDRPHEVINPTDRRRIHLQVDQISATI